MLWQLTRAGIAVLGLYFIGLGLVEWARTSAELLPSTSATLSRPLTLENAHLGIALRVTWHSFAFPAAFGLLLVLLSGPISLLLVPSDAERRSVGLPELISLGVSLIGLFLLLTAASGVLRTLLSGVAMGIFSDEIHPSHVAPFFLADLGQALVGYLIVKNSQRISRWV